MAVDVLQQHRVFLEYLEDWFQGLKPFFLQEEVPDPARAALFSADMVVGFCSRGSLASPRVGMLAGPVVDLFQRAHDYGIQHFVLDQDTHHRETPEFQAFSPHCVRGTGESETIPELQALPFAHRFTVIEKNSLHPAIGTGFDPWLEAHPQLREAIVVGDCTDLCIYSLAMHLRLLANAHNIQGFKVIVPANAVDTYDLPVEMAQEVEAYPHPGDFFHMIFLYHLALNGCQVVREVQ